MKKKIVLSCLLFVFSVSIKAQNNQTLVDQLFETTKVTEMVSAMVNTVITNFKQKATHIPESYWQEIIMSIDYSGFIDNSKEVYLDNYSEEELQELITLYKRETMESYKAKVKKVEKPLYELGLGFGRNIVQQITDKIKAYR